MSENITNIGNVQIIFSSERFGQGKSVAMLSYNRPDRVPRRLVIDLEMRDSHYKSPSGVDDHEQFLYGFDDFADVYGWITKENFLKLYADIREGGTSFPYNVLCIDNLAMLQGVLMSLMQEKKAALEIAKAIGLVYQENRLFLDTRFRAVDAGGMYTLLKSTIKWFLMTCKRAGVDVISTTESHNVWVNYGRKGAQILGRKTKALDPWIQFADLCVLLDRTEGSREKGTARLVGPPRATLDPFNPKHSLPGVAPEFVMDNWESFWAMALSRTVPTDEQWRDVPIPKAESPEYVAIAIEGPATEDEAKREIADLAVQHGWMKATNDKAGADEMTKAAAEKEGLLPSEMFSKFKEWTAFAKAGTGDDKAEEPPKETPAPPQNETGIVPGSTMFPVSKPKPAQHWADLVVRGTKQTLYERLLEWAASKGGDETVVLAGLNVSDVHDYTGSPEMAKAAVETWMEAGKLPNGFV